MFEASAVYCALQSKLHVSVSKVAWGMATVLLALLLPVAASAYTLVMRSGRRVEIPAKFTVTSTAVTYEVAPGIAYTVQLSGVDLAATERINQEPAGSFINRAAKVAEQNGVSASAPPNSPAKQTAKQRVVTNEDLEASRRQRVASEEADKRQRVQQGLPTREELQRSIEDQDRRLRELALQLEASRTAAQYEALRAEVSALNRQIGELRVQQSQAPATYGNGFFNSGFYPYANYYPYVYTLPPFNAFIGRLGGDRRFSGSVFSPSFGTSLNNLGRPQRLAPSGFMHLAPSGGRVGTPRMNGSPGRTPRR